MNNFNKVTVGFVIQHFVDGPNGKFICNRQEFVAGDEVSHEDTMGEVLDPIPDYKYQTFDMVQPDYVLKKGDIVKLVKLDCKINIPYTLEKYIGLWAVVIKPGTGENVNSMIRIKFKDGNQYSFWPEELELITKNEK